ncbi:hypothetical protein [Achromobacter xylosoxidans]|uniref:hypothetical protein n=1 Tax=Alcaligenes xylosoxydans xylosoxydans TaxID=85698 RepID=UPI0006C38B56|nr:hypothetical protein [Achromobacter xylosoxidans]WPQ35257.1 hypothetical protein SLH34_32450 [Achromobacter xylosoxidans]CUI29503.1 Uncharacterised protein [Achromobacter xylosoxidans]
MSFRKPHVVRTRLPGRRERGHWIEGEPGPEKQISASVQPAKAADYEQLQANPEGRRVRAAVRIYTTAQLAVAGQDWTGGDRLVWHAAPMAGEYLLVGVAPWQSGVIPHFRYLAVLLADNELMQAQDSPATWNGGGRG